MSDTRVGPYALNEVTQGDSFALVDALPPASVDIIVTSPPYWGQRMSEGLGVEADPRVYLDSLTSLFAKILPKLKDRGVIWINLGDAYNTPVNWRKDDWAFSNLGAQRKGLKSSNSAYVKPRAPRKAYVDPEENWLSYGNLLALPYRLVTGLCNAGYLFRGEVIWKKKNPLPEGRCRRPHRQHEAIYLLSRSEQHNFRRVPPVKSVWEIANERVDGIAHYSRYPEELPTRCVEAYGITGSDVLVFDPFSGSGTTGTAALKLGCSFIGFEIDQDQVDASNIRLRSIKGRQLNLPVS